ncbi:ribbon-helix-helix domain-containing protein [Roseospira navarrensis]|uniref:Aryl-sulfate sulfotransferase n=1 Tax=Roseospira navarrensis TaxID=140058 RepID=A0A7X1ZFJ0_9PROT|nr:ribbon-helix-helix domain-containing protein [Roseospira navarrensis]MQX37586.1 aryl-sulfate sulfotransferase [Roseospira navarrensis]
MTLRKRSITIAGHATSVSLEEPFWDALREIAARDGRTVADLVTAVDTARTTQTDGAPGNLSSALRVYVLAHYQARCAAPSAE